MRSLASIDTTFASALAAQAESAGTTRIEATGDSAVTANLGRLLATIDPTRSAFASALNRIDVTNAPKVSGPYVPGAASGALTEDDIFDPSRLYSLPGKELVVFDGDSASRAKTEIMRHADGERQVLRTVDNPGTSQAYVFEDGVEDDAERPTTTASSTRNVMPNAGRPTDMMPAGVDGRQPPLALELAVAGYLSLLKTALSPMKRKAPRRVMARDAARSRNDRQDEAEENEKEDENAP